MGPNCSLPIGCKIIKDMKDNSYYFIFNDKEYGPYKTRFIARNNAIINAEFIKSEDLKGLCKETIEFINSNK